MKKIFIGTLFSIFFLYFSPVYAEISVTEKLQYDRSVISLERALDSYIQKLPEEQQKNIMNSLVERLDMLSFDTNSDKLQYIFSELGDIYYAKNIFSKGETYFVERVIDGDTIEIKDSEEIFQIRFVGIDTPERGECFYNEAKDILSEKIVGKNIIFSYDETQDAEDIFGRKLGYIFGENGEFLNYWMIENGYAQEYTYQKAYMFQDFFKNADTKASFLKIGKWNCNEDQENISVQENLEVGNRGYYTSSHHTSFLYYCESDSAWEGLSKTYLQYFESEGELLEKYPSKTLNKPCE